MAQPSRLNPERVDFSRELRGFHPEVAAELEDHLHEAMARALADGAGPAQARREALRGLGDLMQLQRDLERAERSPLGFRVGLSWPMKIVIGAWMAFGLLLVSRICAAQEPTFGSIAASLGFGVGCTLLGSLLLRGGRRSLDVARAGSIAALLAFGTWWSAAASSEFLGTVAIQPWMLFAGMTIALATVALLFVVHARGAPVPRTQ